jgi:hypothetical protein
VFFCCGFIDGRLLIASLMLASHELEDEILKLTADVARLQIMVDRTIEASEAAALHASSSSPSDPLSIHSQLLAQQMAALTAAPIGAAAAGTPAIPLPGDPLAVLPALFSGREGTARLFRMLVETYPWLLTEGTAHHARTAEATAMLAATAAARQQQIVVTSAAAQPPVPPVSAPAPAAPTHAAPLPQAPTVAPTAAAPMPLTPAVVAPSATAPSQMISPTSAAAASTVAPQPVEMASGPTGGASAAAPLENTNPRPAQSPPSAVPSAVPSPALTMSDTGVLSLGTRPPAKRSGLVSQRLLSNAAGSAAAGRGGSTGSPPGGRVSAPSLAASVTARVSAIGADEEEF